jgi:hypothetical protein
MTTTGPNRTSAQGRTRAKTPDRLPTAAEGERARREGVSPASRTSPLRMCRRSRETTRFPTHIQRGREEGGDAVPCGEEGVSRRGKRGASSREEKGCGFYPGRGASNKGQNVETEKRIPSAPSETVGDGRADSSRHAVDTRTRLINHHLLDDIKGDSLRVPANTAISGVWRRRKGNFNRCLSLGPADEGTCSLKANACGRRRRRMRLRGVRRVLRVQDPLAWGNVR